MSAITRHQASGMYQPWQPPDFGRRADDLPTPPPEREAELPPEPLEAEAAIPDLPPEPEAPPIKLPTAEEIEEIYESSRKAGYDAGYEEGTARGRVEAMQLHGLVENLDNALQAFDAEVADGLLELAVEVARHLVRTELRCHPEAVVDAVREALQQFPQNNAMIHIHPDDAILVREYLSDHLAHLGHRLVDDEGITRGGCRLEATGSELDATVETRWKRIMANLGREEDFDGEAD